MKIWRSRMVAAFLGGGAIASIGAELPSLDAAVGAPIVMTEAEQFDFRSRENQREYRLFTAKPPSYDPARSYPVLYILDGNFYFAAARDIMHYLAAVRSPRFIPAIIVGIGYPTTSAQAANRRFLDFTPRENPEIRERTGGSEGFIRLLLQEVRPFVQKRFNVDERRETLYGKSLGGLVVLQVMLRHPEAFDSYIAASASIQWDDHAVLKEVTRPGSRTLDEQGPAKIQLLMLSGGRESNQIKNNEAFALELAAAGMKTVDVFQVSFPEENHSTVSLAALGRAVRFALSGQP